MTRMGVYDQIKRAFQDLIAPELHAMRGELRLLDQKIDGVDARLTTKIEALDQKVDSVKYELLSEIRRVDTRIDGLDREVRTAIDIRERLAALEARRGP